MIKKEETPLEEHLIYTVNEVSQLLKVNKKTVYTLIEKGILKSIRLGCTKVTKQSLFAFLNQYDGYDLNDLENIKCISEYKNLSA